MRRTITTVRRLRVFVAIGIVLTTISHGSSQSFILRQTIDTEGGVLSVSFAPDGKSVVCGGENVLGIYDVATGILKWHLKGHTGAVNAVTFSSDGKLIASASDDGSINIWEAETGKNLRSIIIAHPVKQTSVSHDYRVLSVEFSPDGKRIATGSGGYDEKNGPMFGEVALWEVATGKSFIKFPQRKDFVWSVAFSPDGDKLLTGLGNSKIEIWDLRAGALARQITGQQSFVTSVVWSPEGRSVITGGKDRTVKVWNSETGKLLKTLRSHKHEVACVTMVTTSVLYSADREGTIIAWDLRTGKVISSLESHDSPLNSLAVSRMGDVLVSGVGDWHLRFWRLAYSTSPPPNKSLDASGGSVFLN